MKINYRHTPKLLLILLTSNSFGQNPIVGNQFTADPTARVFEGKVYVYPSHDVAGIDGKGRKNWFVMEDYHVFSSENLTNWTDHGVIVSQNKVNWVDSASYSMWAPDCIEKEGKYYFYFPAFVKDTTKGKGFGIGVAIADKPYGPFVPQQEPIKNVRGIDPNVFIDNDGQAYLYWASGELFVAKLNNNLLELATEPQTIANLPKKGLKEGPFLFERKGTYYLTYPHVRNKTESLEYAVADNPLGPFEVKGVIMDESPSGCWTNHQSIIEYNRQWYLFYHHNDYSPQFDKNRSIRIDSLFFNEDGTIQKVKPTLRGVGTTMASSTIQIDQYSRMSMDGVKISFLDSLDTFKGWKTVLENQDTWIQYNAVDFGNKKYHSVQVNTLSQSGGILQIRLNNLDGPLLSEVAMPKGNNWNTVDSELLKSSNGIQNLVLVLKSKGTVEIDWIRFKE
ncbi:MAG: family 43 glycosylhydrolase [Salinivirgaceae bacterium]